MSTIVPVLLIKNEEIWIKRILTSLANVFPHIIVTDTGSTDSTAKQVSLVPQATLYHRDGKTPQQLTECRQFMQDEAKRLFGATHIFLCDGDELYLTKYLRYIADNPMAENGLSGFTTGIECCELENGEFWYYGLNGARVEFNRQTIIQVDSRWKGDYPFESPDSHIPGHPLNHYFAGPDDSYRFFHLHHTRRSYRDSDVYLRVQKRNQFSMRDAPEIQPFKLWLRNWDEYVDE